MYLGKVRRYNEIRGTALNGPSAAESAAGSWAFSSRESLHKESLLKSASKRGEAILDDDSSPPSQHDHNMIMLNHIHLI